MEVLGPCNLGRGPGRQAGARAGHCAAAGAAGRLRRGLLRLRGRHGARSEPGASSRARGAAPAAIFAKCLQILHDARTQPGSFCRVRRLSDVLVVVGMFKLECRSCSSLPTSSTAENRGKLERKKSNPKSYIFLLNNLCIDLCKL